MANPPPSRKIYASQRVLKHSSVRRSSGSYGERDRMPWIAVDLVDLRIDKVGARVCHRRREERTESVVRARDDLSVCFVVA